MNIFFEAHLLSCMDNMKSLILSTTIICSNDIFPENIINLFVKY